MARLRNSLPRLALFAALLSAPVAVPVALAAEGVQRIEEVVVVGSRRAARSAGETPVPVDVISGSDFQNLGSVDIDEALRSLVPSYNVNQQPISDEATLIRPANLRGLPPDNTLVLVNGKRRHRGGIISFLGGGIADGAQGPDVSPIPSIALKQVEVLRDGAAAQYGSDAIAGVINFVLKDDREGLEFEARYGEFYKGEDAFRLSANVGLPLGESGFLNIAGQFSESDDTDRSVQRLDAIRLIEQGLPVANPAQIWGAPQLDDDYKLIFNAGFDVNENVELYAFGNYAEKTVEGGFFFRNPLDRTGVFDDGSNQGPSGSTFFSGLEPFSGQLLVGDLNPANGIDCPTVAVTNNAIDPVALASISAGGALDAECFVFNEMFPGGFTPRFGGDVTDSSIVVGVRGELNNGLTYDLSGSWGQSEVDFRIFNTVNASLGPATPTDFDPGVNTQTEVNFNADFSFPVKVDAFHSDLNVAFGFEYRDEEFEVEVGQLESFQIGPLAAQGFASGSNGFSGFGPQSEGKFSRDNVAIYVDLEADVTERLVLAAALRWEDFEDFGTTTNGKIAGNFSVNDNFAVRGSLSTGFRAPTPGQSNIVRTVTQLIGGQLTETGVLPPTNPIVGELATLASGGEFTSQPLDSEESTNWTLGAVFNAGDLSVTLDYFNINVEDRIALTRDIIIDRTDPAQLAILDQLNAAGVPGANTLTAFQFFTNDFETDTQGIDLVATYPVEWGGGVTNLSFAFNWTETELDKLTPVVDNTRRIELEDNLPSTRFVLTANHTMGPWRFLVRSSFYDDFRVADNIGSDIAGTFDGKYGSEILFDAEVAYTLRDNYTFVVGAQNIFDEFPDENPDPEVNSGQRYPEGSPLGFNGGFWYLRFLVEI